MHAIAHVVVGACAQTRSPPARPRFRDNRRDYLRYRRMQRSSSCNREFSVAAVDHGCSGDCKAGHGGDHSLMEQQADDHHHGQQHHHDHGHSHHHHDKIPLVGCCSGYSEQGGGHSHFELKPSWGMVRRFLFNCVSRLGMFRFSDSVSHSVSSAVASGLLLTASCAILYIRPESVLGQWTTLSSAATTAAVAGSLVLSATPAILDAFYKALQAQVDAHTLMAVAGASSFALGFPLEGALLFSLFHVAHVLEGVFVNRAQSNLSGLIDSLPKTIRIVSPAQDGTIDWISQEQVPVDDVAIGSLIAVKPGELVPLDGTVHSGTALLGQESITGESLPVLKRPGSNVYSGGQVHDGTLIIRTTTRATDTTTARIVRITSTAMRNKAAVQTFLSRVTSRWSQALISLTMLALVTLIATGVPLLGKHGALYRALALLTAGAPCALALAPLTFVCAMATLSRNGIIVKGSNVLDRLAGISFVALDKTGTLSEGQLRFVSTTPLQPGSSAAKADALVKAAALSLQGTHPVCDAVLDAYGDMGGARAASLLPTVTSFQLVPGAGMSGEVDGKKCLFGSVEHVRDCLNPTQVDMLRQAVEQHGAGHVVSVLLVYGLPGRGSTHGASDVESMHVLAFSDMPKKDSGQGMQLIRKLCRGVGMYTGDNAASAAILGKLVGLRHGEVHAGLAPEGKSDSIKALQQQGEHVFMVGDGLNDAPALATADVSAVFTESVDTSVAGVADVAVLREGTAGAHGGDVGRVAFLLQMAQSARVNVMQNLGLAVVSMVVAVVPSLMGVLPLWIAVLVHEGSTVLVALNSCRLLFMRPRMV